jgi:hypothetical protein
MPTLTTTEQKNLRFFARSRLGLNDNASIKTIIKSLNDPSVNVNNFYSKMKKFQEEEEKAFIMEEARKRDVEFAKKVKESIAKEKVKKEKAKAKRKEKRNENKQFKNVIEFKPSEKANPQTDFYYLMKSKMGKNLIIELVSDGINETFNEEIPASQKAFNQWWNSKGEWILRYSSDTMKYDEYSNIKVFIYESKEVKIPVKKLKQFFKDGSINCVLKPIIQWASEKHEEASSKSAKSRYNTMLKNLEEFKNKIGNDGADENIIQEISDKLQIDISIEKPLVVKEQENKYVFEAKSNKKPLKHFILRNTRVNHVDLNEYTYLNNIEFVKDKDELLKIKKECDLTNTNYEFTKDITGYTSICTLDKTYKVSNEFSEMVSEFEIKTGLNNCYIDYINDNELSNFVINSVHYNGTIDFKNIDEYRYGDYKINHYDMETAYTQFKQCRFYKGFLGKISDYRLCNKIEGVGIYKIDNLKFTNKAFEELNNKMNIYINKVEYPSVELDFLTSMGCTFDIICGCWGIEALDFEFSDEMFKKYDDIKGYAKYVGKCNSIYTNKKYWINGNSELAQIIKDNEFGKVEYFSNDEICLSYPKKNVFHLSQFTSFITAYQRIQVLEQLMKMNRNNLIRVCVDGIYYEGEEHFEYPFVDKSDKIKLCNDAGDSYISNNTGYEITNNIKREHNNKELHVGEGGNGKTHFNLLDKGLCRVLYVAPSYKLASKKKQEYNVNVEVWANILTSDVEKISRIKKYHNVLIIDECSMMTENDKQKIFKTYSDMKLIFCGDIGFQAPPFSINGEPVVEIKKDGFRVIEYTKNYRFKCEKLKSLISDVRRFIKHDASDYFVNEYVREQFNLVNDDFVKENYKIEDMILSRSHNTKNRYTEYFSEMNKWYITKNSRYFHNGDIIVGNKPDTECEIRHSFTIHSIQGETADHKLYINMDNIYDKRLLYTAISRARTINQIVIIKN